jgi:hypothetical protein
MAQTTKQGAADRARDATQEEREWMEENAEGLSDSTLRARWIHSHDEAHGARGETLATRDPEVIRAWAEERDAAPVTATRGDDGTPRALRLDFGASTDGLERVEWDEWLGVVADRDLVFIFQEKKKDGSTSNFWRLDSPERQDG